MRSRVHILGASGSGTSTLGNALAARLGYRHLDTDQFYWLPSDPPFLYPRERAERQTLLGGELVASEGWVLSGSLCGWGDRFIPLFDLVVFMCLPPAVRLARLRAREEMRYGADAIAAGGPLHERHVTFIEWAAAYDDGGFEIRSRRLHEEWLRALPCPILRLADPESTAVQLERVLQRLTELAPPHAHGA